MMDRYVAIIHSSELMEDTVLFFPSKPAVPVIEQVSLEYIFGFVPLFSPIEMHFLIVVIEVHFMPLWIRRIGPSAYDQGVGRGYGVIEEQRRSGRMRMNYDTLFGVRFAIVPESPCDDGQSAEA